MGTDGVGGISSTFVLDLVGLLVFWAGLHFQGLPFILGAVRPIWDPIAAGLIRSPSFLRVVGFCLPVVVRPISSGVCTSLLSLPC